MSVYTKNLIIGLSMMMALLLACAGVVWVEVDKVTNQHDTTGINAANTAALAAIDDQDLARTIQASEAVQERLAKVNPDAIPMTHPDIIQARQVIAFLPVVRALAIAADGRAVGDVGMEARGLLEVQHGWDNMPTAARLPMMHAWTGAAQADLNDLRHAHTAEVDAAQDAIIKERVVQAYIGRCGNVNEAQDDWDAAIGQQLRTMLHDPSSAEMLGCSGYESTPSCWRRTCRIRAKNQFGAFVVSTFHATLVKGVVADIQFE